MEEAENTEKVRIEGPQIPGTNPAASAVDGEIFFLVHQFIGMLKGNLKEHTSGKIAAQEAFGGEVNDQRHGEGGSFVPGPLRPLATNTAKVWR